MDGEYYSIYISKNLTHNNPLSGSHHAGVPPTDSQLNMPVIPVSTYTAALKEYEDLDETDSEGDGLSW